MPSVMCYYLKIARAKLDFFLFSLYLIIPFYNMTFEMETASFSNNGRDVFATLLNIYDGTF